MQKIKEILKKFGIEISEDAEKEINKNLKENYVEKSIFSALEGDCNSLKEKMRKNEIDFQVKTALIKSGAKNEKALEGFIDRDKLEIADGKALGIDEMIKSIKKENPYLFYDVQKDTGTMHLGIPSVNPDDLSDEEYYKNLFKEN